MKKIKWGVIGTGMIAKQFATDMNFVADGVLYSVVGRELSKTQRFADQFGFTKFCTSVDEIVEDPNIDCLYIATPHPLHAEQILLALKNGKNVLCEKPFTMNAAEAEQVIKVAQEKKLFLMEAMWTRFLPAISRVRELIIEGAIGRLEFIELSMDLVLKIKNQIDYFFLNWVAVAYLIRACTVPLFLKCFWVSLGRFQACYQ